MSFKNVVVVLASAVAQNGTFTATYPSGYSAGSFAAYGHQMMSSGLQNKFTQDDGTMSVSFGATTATITYKGSTSIPAVSKITVQLNQVGQDDRQPWNADKMKRMVKVPTVLVNLGAPITADADGLCESQTVTFATTPYAVFDGAQSDLNTPSDVAPITLDVPRNVVAAWTSTAIITVTGKDEYGDVIIEKSASGTSLTGKKAFKTITSVAMSANVTGLTVGFGDVLGLPCYVDSAANVVTEFVSNVPIGRRPSKVFIPFEIEATELAAGTAEQIVSPVAGFINSVRGIVESAVTTGGPVTVEINGVAVTGLTFTVANSDAAGTRYSDTPTTWHGSTTVLAAGDQITITPDAAFATAGQLNGVLEIDVLGTSLLDGTFVAGVQTLPTATTGDTKGTYDPSAPCDGTTSFALLCQLPDPTYKGVDNYDG